MNTGRRLRVRSGSDFAFVNAPTMSGVDRRVSIRTTLVTSPTRVQDTEGSRPRTFVVLTVTTRRRIRSMAPGSGPVQIGTICNRGLEERR